MTGLVLIGCGAIARDGYLPALAHLRPSHVTVVDPLLEAREAAAARLCRAGIDAEAVDTAHAVGHRTAAAIVAVPPVELAGAVNELLSVQYPPAWILLEKPVGPDYATGRRLVERATQVTQVAYMETFLHSSAYDVMMDELASGRLGQPQSLKMAVRGSTPTHLDVQWRGDRSVGGEVLHDWGIHSLGLALHLAATVTQQRGQSTVSVTDAEWATVGSKDILVSCAMEVQGFDISVDVAASWDGPVTSPDAPDVMVKCERGALGLLVRKTDGSSDWACLEYSGPSVRELAARRYPKELFIRGVDGFLRLAGGGQDLPTPKYQISLGLEALSLADSAYSQAEAR